MTDVVVFVANGFNKENIRLQPWRYVFEIAQQRGKGRSVVVITDGDEDKEIERWDDNFDVIKTRYLSVKKQKQLREIILELNPDELWWSTTPRTVAFNKLLSKVECRLFLFMTCPLYSWHQLIRAVLAGVPFRQTKALIQQRFIPRFLVRKFFNQQFIHKVFVQSCTNERILKKIKVNEDKIFLLPVGIDEADFTDVDKNLVKSTRGKLPDLKDDSVVFLYFGALRPIRGFDALMKAIPEVLARDVRVRFVILARGADDKLCGEVIEKLRSQGIDDRVRVIGGWLSREEVWAYIENSDVAVLPFVLVPSDIPIAALEALARGIPILVSPVDGLPDLAKDRGMVVDPLNKKAFTDSILSLTSNDDHRRALGVSARKYMSEQPRWSQIGSIIEKITA